jgi:AbrB family looped-hinge helix DNA binding protein
MQTVFVAKIMSNGSVTIPAAMRKKYRIRPGTILEFEITASGTVTMQVKARIPQLQTTAAHR